MAVLVQHPCAHPSETEALTPGPESGRRVQRVGGGEEGRHGGGVSRGTVEEGGRTAEGSGQVESVGKTGRRRGGERRRAMDDGAAGSGEQLVAWPHLLQGVWPGDVRCGQPHWARKNLIG